MRRARSPSLLSFQKLEGCLVLNWYEVKENGEMEEFLSERIENFDANPDIITFVVGNELYFLHYENNTGKTTVFRFDSTNQGSKTVAQFQFKSNSILMPISKENHISIFLYSNDDGVVEVYDISNALPGLKSSSHYKNNNRIEGIQEKSESFTSYAIPSLIENQKSPLECKLQSMFQIGNDKWSKGWKFKLFCINNNSYCICYKPESGRASFDCFETINGFQYQHISDYMWQSKLSITPFVIEGIPYLLFYDKANGKANFRKLHVESGEIEDCFEGQWTTDWKFTPMLIEGRIWFLSYKKNSGLSSLDVLTLHNGLNYHNIWRREIPKNRSFKACMYWNLFQLFHNSNLLKVLTLNVFHDITSNPVVTQQRLQLQIDRVKTLQPDIICLQEAYHPIVSKTYGENFPTYAIFESERGIGVGYYLLKLLHGGLTFTFSVISFILLRMILEILQSGYLSVFEMYPSIITLIAICYVITHSIMTHTRLNYIEKFLTDTSLGLVILTNQAKLTALPSSSTTRKFISQDGDFLNTFKPRGFLHLQYLLSPPPSSSLSSSSSSTSHSPLLDVAEEKKLSILNTHLNTGVTNPKRVNQVAELLQFVSTLTGEDNTQQRGKGEKNAESAPHLPPHPSHHPSITHLQSSHPILLCGDTNSHPDQVDMKMLFNAERNGFVDCWEAITQLPGRDQAGFTWNNVNPLTSGLLREPDQRVDYIAYRIPASSAYEISPVDCNVVFNSFPFVSDHFGVFATFTTFTLPSHNNNNNNNNHKGDIVNLSSNNDNDDGGDGDNTNYNDDNNIDN